MADVQPVTDAAVTYGDQRAEEAAVEATAPLEQQIATLEAQVADLTQQLADCESGGEPPVATVAYPPIFGGATTNNQTDFNKLNTLWGPIRMTREYDGGGGFAAVNNYSWFNFSKQFNYIAFSADEQKSNASYDDVANGKHDTKIRTMIDSVKSQLTGKKGVILLGNEPNTEIAANDGGHWRAAMEHCIDTFGYKPAPGFMWGIAFSNYNVWGPGSNSAGKTWLPRRDEGPFMVETHFYGRDGYGDPAKHLGNLIKEMGNHPKWQWGIGEISAQEDPTHTKKAKWFTDVWAYCKKNKIAYFLPFDTNVGGSADVATSTESAKAVKAIAVDCQNNNWSISV
jgi:hypothetical protein